MQTLHYDGSAGDERIVCCVREAWGRVVSVEVYSGARGVESKVRAEYRGGSVGHFEGARGSERLVRLEEAHRTTWFEGSKGRERVVAAASVDE